MDQCVWTSILKRFDFSEYFKALRVGKYWLLSELSRSTETNYIPPKTIASSAIVFSCPMNPQKTISPYSTRSIDRLAVPVANHRRQEVGISSAESAPIMVPRVPKPCPQLEGPRGIPKTGAQAGFKLEIRYIWDDETDRNGESLSALESSRFAGDIKNPPNTMPIFFAVWSYFYKDHPLLNVISEWSNYSPTPLSPNPSMDQGHKSYMIKNLQELQQ
ncbi:hypothetical protein B9Z55_028222 [Caenorhabditis nigoni]|uniref:Uncharacterized protein n=1 Tax=Caenorhabditis nigoni TaxID=1611254 RepID=A0A2G5SCT9_9PELO|nr:hypothetical protein B9Z55_028222 [Caenorhabditis nigoni]